MVFFSICAHFYPFSLYDAYFSVTSLYVHVLILDLQAAAELAFIQEEEQQGLQFALSLGLLFTDWF